MFHYQNCSNGEDQSKERRLTLRLRAILERYIVDDAVDDVVSGSGDGSSRSLRIRCSLPFQKSGYWSFRMNNEV